MIEFICGSDLPMTFRCLRKSSVESEDTNLFCAEFKATTVGSKKTFSCLEKAHMGNELISKKLMFVSNEPIITRNGDRCLYP